MQSRRVPGPWILLAVLALAPAGAATCADCDEDGFFTILDALAAARMSAGLAIPSAAQLIVCDVDGTGTLGITDALLIAQFVVGLPVTLACPPPGPTGATRLFVNVGNAIEIVDLTTDSSLGTLPQAGVGQGIDIDDAGAFVYATFGGNLIEVDTATEMVTRTLPLSLTASRKVAVGGGFAYVAHFAGSGMSTIDRVHLATGVVTSTLVARGAWEITLSGASDQLWVGHIGLGDAVTRIPTGTFTAATSTPLSNNPISIEEDPVTGDIYVGARDAEPDVSGPNDLHVRNPSTLASVGTYAIDDAFGIAVTPDGSFLYVASNHQTGAPVPPYFVQKIDLVTMTVLATMIPVGNQPWYFAMDPSGAFLYTCDNASSQITKIDTATDTVSATIPLSAGPRDAVAR